LGLKNKARRIKIKLHFILPQFTPFHKLSLLALVMVFISNIAISQTDTTSVSKQDTTTIVKTENSETQKSEEKEKKEKKKRSEIIAYGGVTFNQINMSSTYEP
jgi:hypothetical protein